jgi:hypothetical protein
MQAAIASLFDTTLEDVPNFIEYKDGWFSPLWEFIQNKGYSYQGMLHNKNHSNLYHPTLNCFKKENWFSKSIISPKKLYKEQGVNGLFFASVLSPKYCTINDGYHSTHAVIIDKDYNIVHDPNPEYENILKYPLADLLKYNGIIDVFLINPKNN